MEVVEVVDVVDGCSGSRPCRWSRYTAPATVLSANIEHGEVHGVDLVGGQRMGNTDTV